MSSPATADIVLPEAPDQSTVVHHDSSEHDLPARTMAEEDGQEQAHPHGDDPATMAASEDLKHTSISDKVRSEPQVDRSDSEVVVGREDKHMVEIPRSRTPEADPTDIQDEEMRERLSSPKKKRGRDDDTKELDDDKSDEPSSSADGSTVNGGRTTRSEPEKKRPRDTSEGPLQVAGKPLEKAVDVNDTADSTKSTADGKNDTPPQKPTSNAGDSHNDKPQTSSSAFSNSGFASLAASSTSPFGTIGASKPSVFGGSSSKPSGFGGLAAAQTSSATSTTTVSGFGAMSSEKPSTGFSFGSGTTTGFGGLSSGSVFGSKIGNGFAASSGPKLSSFAAPGSGTIVGAKPAKAFGAPESDEDEGSGEDDSEGDEDTDDEESAHVVSDDKKKSKVSKVHVDDGEAGETTLLQLRAKLFALESKEAGWKERGVGTLKINVPKCCTSFDENDLPIPGSFDASGLDDAEENSPRVPRLIMRQENTHRVVLNTIIIPAMEFTPKSSASAAQILFTAFEGEKELKPTNMLLKMSEANARLFKNEIDSIQREL